MRKVNGMGRGTRGPETRGGRAARQAAAGALLSALAVLALLAGSLPLAAQRDSESARQEANNEYLRTWLEEEAAYIITPEEREAFNSLSTDEEREQFIEQFWLRRDPDPDTARNEYVEEHYRRINYANDHFYSGVPGWMTDRGRIYILWGPPDQIISKPTGGNYERPREEGGGYTTVFPFEQWRYRYLPNGLGQEVVLEFVDKTFSNEYSLATSPNEKDALAHVPGTGYTDLEMLLGEDERDSAKALRGIGVPGFGFTSEFDLLELRSKIFVPPSPEFRDLEEIVTTNLSFNLLPFEVRADAIRVTNATVQVPITIQIRNGDVTLQNRGGVHVGSVNIFGRLESRTGQLVDRFEETVEFQILDSQFEASLDTYRIYQRSLYLQPGAYKLDIAVKDTTSEDLGTTSLRVDAPRFQDDQMATSSLILAHSIDPVPARQVGTGMFILGDLKVLPSVRKEFYRDSDLGYWMQVYNLETDESTSLPSASVQTTITRDGREMARITDGSERLAGGGRQMTLHREIPLAEFEPGRYTIQVRVIDDISGNVQVQTDDFVVMERPAV